MSVASTRCRLVTLGLLSLLLCLPLASRADNAADTDADNAALEHLKEMQLLVGQWRGVGQVRRGSTAGAWTVSGEWAWHFGDQSVLRYQAPQGKHIRQAELAADAGGLFTMQVTDAAGEKHSYQGRAAGEERQPLVLVSDDRAEPARITLRFVAGGDRLLMLLESRSPASGRFSRMAEVGYTRKGSLFGAGRNYVECVVTGGKGTIPVSYQGQTYYVCCTGCRDYFNENPEAVLAEYRERQELERKKREQAGDGAEAEKPQDQ